jgi:hypothetical protein
VVDPSLLRQAADRGVTICFADLDGADGLWVPEERTVLVNRGLSEAQVADVIEHELAHVMIDDQHADLDAGKDVLVGRPPARSNRPVAMALTAVALLGVVGGVWIGVTRATDGGKQDQVAPNPDGTGLTAQESPNATTTVVPTRLPDGRIVYPTQVVTRSAPPPSATVDPTAATPAPSASGTRPAPAPRPPARTTGAPLPPQTSSSAAPTPPVDTGSSATVPPIDPTTPDPVGTTPADASEAGDPAGDGVGEGGNPAGDAAGDGVSSPEPAGASVAVDDVSAVVSGSPGPVAGPSN